MSRKAKNTLARDELEGRIGYAFADKAILERALTHERQNHAHERD